MKMIALSITLGLLLSATALAQPNSRQGKAGWERPDPAQRVARMTQALGLDEAQAEALLVVLTEAEAERETLREQHMLDMCALLDRTMARVDDILSDEQLLQLDELKAQKENRRDENRGQHGKPRGPSHACEGDGV